MSRIVGELSVVVSRDHKKGADFPIPRKKSTSDHHLFMIPITTIIKELVFEAVGQPTCFLLLLRVLPVHP